MLSEGDQALGSAGYRFGGGVVTAREREEQFEACQEHKTKQVGPPSGDRGTVPVSHHGTQTRAGGSEF